MILEQEISLFRNTRDTTIDDEVTVGEVLKRIKEGTYKNLIDKVRAGDEEAKKQLPTAAMHGKFEYERKKDQFIEASGLIILDIDDVELDEIEETKQEIIGDSNHILSCMVSPSGNGIKILYYIQPELITAENYRQIGKQIVEQFTIYGKVDYLSVTDCLIMTYDPNIIINENVEPDYIYIRDEVIKTSKLESLDSTKKLWESPEDFFDTVLSNDIEQKTNNNFHFIQVAILDLKKFGFEHPKEDLSFVIDYAEAAFKRSPDNKRRFLEIVEIAKSYPQQFWPYRKVRDDIEDDEEEVEIDYTEYVSKKDIKEDSKKSAEVGEDDIMVNYDELFDKMLEVIQEGDRVGREISLKTFADIFRFKGTGILTITGIPGHGKTEFTDECILDLARLYGEETYVVGFEQSVEEHIIKLIRKLLGVNITCKTWFKDTSNDPLLRNAYDFIISKIKHIDTRKTSEINGILRALATEIQKSREAGGNPKYVVIDPFNMISIKGGRLSGHEKIEEILRRITQFSHQMDVMVMLIAHPFKMRKDEKTGKYEVPDFYSVKGSSAFFEMSYHGLVIYRRLDDTMIRILKVKQNNLGRTGGEAFFGFERDSGRYIPHDIDGNILKGDQQDKDWLEKALKIKQ